MSKTFNFKQFSLTRTKAGMKLSTDAVLLGSWTAQLFPNAQIPIYETDLQKTNGKGGRRKKIHPPS